jgi:hypothetical protein
MDMRFGMWNIRSLYRANFLMTVSRDLSTYRLDLVGVQEVRWEGNENDESSTGFLYIRESYQQLRGLSLLVIRCHT